MSSSGSALLLGHDGGTIGQSAYVRILPDSDLVIALLVNCAQAGAAGTALIDRALEAVGCPPLIPAPGAARVPEALQQADSVIGLYRRTSGTVDVHRGDGDRLQCVIEVEEHLETERLRLEGLLEPQPSGLWTMATPQGDVPLLFLGDAGRQASCVLALGRGHGRSVTTRAGPHGR